MARTPKAEQEELGLEAKPVTPFPSASKTGDQNDPAKTDNEGATEKTETGNAETTSEPKKRGRPAGSGTKSTAEKPKKTAGRKAEDTAAFARQIAGIHQMFVLMTGFGELVIDGQEATMLANALSNMSEEYGIELTGKTGAAIQLLGTASIIYIPRALAANARLRKQAAEAQAKEESNTMQSGSQMATGSVYVGPVN